LEFHDVSSYAAPGAPTTGHGVRSGAYGVALAGVEPAADLLVPVPADAPRYTISTELGHAPTPEEFVTADRAQLRLRSGGQIVVDREAGQVCFRVPHEVRADELVHPYLAPAAAVIGRWRDQESVHAGAFAAGGRVWALVGERESGKSSTLGWLAQSGVEILCDDMVVLDGDVPHAGPRTIDLRADAAERLGVGQAIGITGARERWRVQLGPVVAGRPLAGWIFLAWGERLDVRRLGGAERLARIAGQRGLRLPPARRDGLLDLATLPAFELSRPRGWDSLPAGVERLLELAAG
jgi:hypothetical protein